MNALIKKEIRLLLPGFSLGLLLAIAGWYWQRGEHGFAREESFSSHQFWFLFPSLLLMALSSFGRELSSGTLPVLLTQPISRDRIWRVKTRALVGFASLVVVVWCLLWLSYGRSVGQYGPNGIWRPYGNGYVWISSGLAGFAICSGALWTVLLFRQVAAAFGITLLIPIGIYVVISGIMEREPSDLVHHVLELAFALYGIAGVAYGRWLFGKVQDADSEHVEQIGMPELGFLSRVKGGMVRKQSPRLALLKKEIQLYQAQLAMAVGLGALHLGVLALRRYYPFEANSPVKAVLEMVWVLWMFMPALIGATAVSEERKLRTMDAQACLPVSRRSQFLLKLSVATSIALILGAGLPLLFEGKKILPEVKLEWLRILLADYTQTNQGVWSLFAFFVVHSVLVQLPLMTFVVICLGVAAISFYASTLSRNPLEALVLSSVGTFGAVLLVSLAAYALLLVSLAAYPQKLIDSPLWEGELIFFIGIPATALTGLGLAYWNFQQFSSGWKLWQQNLAVWALSLLLIGALTTVIYNRPWELLTPMESTAGPQRIFLPASPATGGLVRSDFTGDSSRFRVAVVLPDGRVWVNQFYRGASGRVGRMETANSLPSSGRFLMGANWKDARIWNGTILAIAKDGSLWISKPLAGDRDRFLAPGTVKMKQVGQDNQWKSLSSGYYPRLLLKENGTLWTIPWALLSVADETTGYPACVPEQIDERSDWAQIVELDFMPGGRKTNGEVWIYNSRTQPNDGEESLQLTGRANSTWGLRFSRHRELEKLHPVEACCFYSERGQWCEGAVCEDGSFRDLAGWVANRDLTWPADVLPDLRIGSENTWCELISRGFLGRPVLRKANGTLWRFNFEVPPHTAPSKVSLAQVGNRSDWIGGVAVPSLANEGQFVALAADGSLWNWRDPAAWQFEEISHLIRPSRKPTYLGNIFDASH